MTGTRTTTFGFDRRGVSEVIGSILVFALLVTLLSIVQTQLIPAENEAVELEHSQAVQSDFADIRTSTDRAFTTGESASTTFKVGMDYPSRLLFINPPPATGTLGTTETSTITLENVETDASASEFFSTGPAFDYDTRILRYSVDYNQLGSVTYRREPGAAYQQEDGGTIVRETTLVDGNEITLLAVGGNLNENGVAAAEVEAKPLSAPAQQYEVQDDGSPITIRVPTRLSQSKWNELLSEELLSNGGHITSLTVDPGPSGPVDRLVIELEQGVDYNLRMGKVGFGNGGDPTAKYLVRTDTDEPGAAIEVRDRFNNPVSGVELTASVSTGTITNGAQTGSSVTVTTGPDGVANVEVASGTPTSVTFEDDLDGDGTIETGSSVPDERETAFFVDSVFVTDANGSDGTDQLDFTLTNNGPERTVQQVQLHYVTELRGASALESVFLAGPTAITSTETPVTNVTDGPDEITQITVDGTSTSVSAIENSRPATIPGGTTVTLGSGSKRTLNLTLDESYEFGTNPTLPSSDMVSARFTIYFTDGSKKTFDVMLNAAQDSS